MPSDIGDMALHAPSHIGIVVQDVDKTTEFLSSICGIGPWQTLESSVSKDEIIVGEPFTLKIAWARLGPLVLELLQPVKGRSIWSQFLETKGEGLHHIAFSVQNWDEMVSSFQERGNKMVSGAAAFAMEGAIFKERRWCYFDTKPGGIVIEFEEKLEGSKTEQK